ncbi:muscleblind-like protein 1 isoform X1 [Sitophilus oryzae]|uniref:Muscleblind-like protein 1 isoform X1 n=1 Tax=Sitophilus oryzae TaxID=7048 RepID=A0A6J2YHB8_SITOR|nr:muscleblind-like protein 1 isoform X1 [Sitophilus oryzae]
MQQMGLTPGQPLVPGQVQAVVDPSIDCLPLTHPYFSMPFDEPYALMAANPYLTGMPQVGSTYSPYFAPGPIMPTIMGPDPTGVGSPLGVVPQTVVAQQKMPRSDRLEVCREFQRGACKRAESECRFAHPADAVTANEDGTVTVCMDAVKGRCNRDPCRYFHPPLHLQAQIKAAQSRASAMDMKSVGSFYYDNFAFPAGMVPYKRPAADKSGVPVYQPNATTYQQLMQLQQPFVPVSCEYPTSPAPPPSSAASPSIPEAAASAHPAAAAAAAAAVMAHQLQQQQQQQQQQHAQPPPPRPASKENESQLSSQAAAAAAVAAASIAPPASMTSLPGAQPMYTDPAALAKEVAQQNYAKAVKLAAMNQSLAHQSQMAPLNPLNYTGVALNKQALGIPQTALRYPPTALPLGFTSAAGAGFNFNLANSYSAAIAQQQQNLLGIGRAAPHTAFQLNPYSIMRPATAYTNAGATTVTASPIFNGSLLGAQYPVTVSAAPVTTVTPSAASIVAAAAQNNNNVQPYKKLKTS